MSETMTLEKTKNGVALPTSRMAESLQGSEIIKLAGEINEKIRKGDQIFNFTIGDFDPQIFPIPELLKEEIIKAYKNNETNYPPASGVESLRKAVASFVKDSLGLDYGPEDYIIASGARPLIYSVFQTILDPGDKVIFPVPSWNNNHYSHLGNAVQVPVETRPENNFMPTADELRPFLKDATLLALCSPLNPTGTTFTREGLMEISQMVLEENQSRPEGAKPLYLMYDQIYWTLTFGKTKHENPVSLIPELKPYTIFIDGLSKAFAATGVRVGWASGPAHIIEKMQSILGHIGAWAPKAEQVATSVFLKNVPEVSNYRKHLKNLIQERLQNFYEGFNALKEEGYPIDVIAPQAAIYLTVKFDLKGQIKPDGIVLTKPSEVTQYLLDTTGVAVVPFYAFGASKDSSWYRLSVGTSKLEDIDRVMSAIRMSLNQLKRN